ncbi:MAG TPA: MFS transporter [Bacilli bacterium]|nr:MFS transporter [Bacilli bacterium]
METSLLKNKNFILLYLGRLVSNFGNIFYNFAIGWFILSLTQSPAQAAAYMAFGAIVFLVLTPFGGVLSDRWDRVKIVYITDFIRGTSIVLAGLVIMYNGTFTLGGLTIDFGSDTFKIVILYITAFIISVNGALFNPAVTTLTPFIVGKEQLQKANASLHAQNALINIAGTVTAAALYASLGIGWIFIINGVAYIGSAVSEIFINVKTKEDVDSQLTVKQVFVDMGQGLSYLFKSRGLFVFTIVAIILNFFSAPVYAIGLPYLYNQVLKTEPIYFSLIGVLASVGTIVMSIIFTLIKQRDRMFKFISWGLLAWIPLILSQAILIYLVVSGVIGFWLFFGISIAIAFLDGNISVFVNTPIGVAFQKYVPREMLGRVNSMLNTLVSGLAPISIALGGLFLEYRSVPELYLISAVGFVIGSIIFFSSKSVKQL